jgi:hypothetical protein
VSPRSPVYVCNSSDAVAFNAACGDSNSDSNSDSDDTAPCFGEWRMDKRSVRTGSSGVCVIGSGHQ